MHKPSFEEEEGGIEGNQSWFGRTRGSAILLWFLSVLSSACWAVNVVQHVGGEILSEFTIGVFERYPPHLFLYMLLSKTRKSVGDIFRRHQL